MFPLLIPAISALGSLFGKSSQARSEARAKEAELNLNRDQLAQRNYEDQLQAALQGRTQDLNEREFALKAPGTKMTQALRGDLIANATKPHLSIPGIPDYQSSGGPNLFSDAAREGGGNLMQQALASLLKGETFDKPTLPTAPGQTPLPQAGKFDTLSNILGYGGAALGALSPLLNRSPGLPDIFKNGMPAMANGLPSSEDYIPPSTGLTPTQLFGRGGGLRL